jgi:hypothetical protein
MEINHKTQFLANIDNMPQTVEHVEIAHRYVTSPEKKYRITSSQ